MSAARVYRLRRPGLTELQAWTANMRRADDAAIAAADDATKARTDRLRCASRTQAAAVALPAAWRSRDRLTEPEWPPVDDLPLWRSLGESHALARPCALLPPAFTPSPDSQPHAFAYALGYLSIQKAYYMPDQHPPVNLVHAVAARHQLDRIAMGDFMLSGDITKIPTDDRAEFIAALCRHVGIDPLERPFMIMSDGSGESKRDVVYATRACAAALCRERGLSREIISVEERTVAGVDMIVARARCTVIETGRYDEATGAVPILQPLKDWSNRPNGKGPPAVTWHMPDPDKAANLVMKAETKAKRRAVLDCVGLGLPDETEVATIARHDAQHYTVEPVEEVGEESELV